MLKDPPEAALLVITGIQEIGVARLVACSVMSSRLAVVVPVMVALPPETEIPEMLGGGGALVTVTLLVAELTEKVLP